MKILGFSRHALTSCAAAAMLAGCGGSQPPGALPQTSAVATHAEHGKSSSGDLMYVASNGKSYVISYPQGKLVGTIDHAASDACSDSAGNVFLPTVSEVLEFAHGSTKPSATLSIPGSGEGCAVDPKTGDLAVSYSPTGDSDLAIFPDAQGQPTYYSVEPTPQFCGYDNQGNLFVDMLVNGGTSMAELPVGQSQFMPITLSPPITTFPGRIQWDGTALTIETGIASRKDDPVRINRLSVLGSTATITSVTKINNIPRVALASWIYDGVVIIPYGRIGDGAANLGYWKYPKGGKRMTAIKHPAGAGLQLIAVTISTGL